MLTCVKRFVSIGFTTYFYRMQERHYKSILYFIGAVILITFGMQGYWNYKNFIAGKQQLINEVQISLDNAVDEYYTNIAEDNLLGISLGNNAFEFTTDSIDSFFDSFEYVEARPNWSGETRIKVSDSGDRKSISIFRGTDQSAIDTILGKVELNGRARSQLSQWHLNSDSMRNNLLELTSRVIFAVTEDTLNLEKMDSLITDQLKRKNIAVNHVISYSGPHGENQVYGTKSEAKNYLSTSSNSAYLPEPSKLTLDFSNITSAILAKMGVGLLFSFLFVVAILSCLLYLLKIIKHQKQLAEVKNDLISNITHEFKTPITTIGIAMEALQNYTNEDDKEKALRYSKISKEQVDKLNVMVEKILETASLNSEELQLNLQPTNLVELLQKASLKEEASAAGKHIQFKASTDEIIRDVDPFHFENAVNNIIDNAIKYGGDEISVTIEPGSESTHISISDNGSSLTEGHKKQIFEKFYRVPKGNQHDVKGFGIGLYYTKKIVEKHRGLLSVSIRPNTVFKISLPNE